MVRFDYINGVAVIRLPADVDASNADTVNEEITSHLSNQTPALVVDLSATRYLDSAGIDMLFRLHERLQTRRQRLLLVLEEGVPLMRVLRIVAIPDIMAVHPSVDSALRAVGGAEGRPVEAG